MFTHEAILVSEVWDHGLLPIDGVFATCFRDAQLCPCMSLAIEKDFWYSYLVLILVKAEPECE
jgi:hypothetical protein